MVNTCHEHIPNPMNHRASSSVDSVVCPRARPMLTKPCSDDRDQTPKQFPGVSPEALHKALCHDMLCHPSSLPHAKPHRQTEAQAVSLVNAKALRENSNRTTTPFWEPCGKPAPASLPSTVCWRSRGRLPCEEHCRCSGLCCRRWCWPAGVTAAHWVRWCVWWLFYPPPARLRQRTGGGPRPGNSSNACPHPSKKGRNTEGVCGNPLPRLPGASPASDVLRSEEHTSELQSLRHLVCRLLL